MVELVFPRRIIYDEDLASSLHQLLEGRNIKSVIIVTDKNIRTFEWFKNSVNKLSSSGLEVCIYDEVPPEPSFDIADAIASTARSCNAKAIVAIGGGSVIDAAKAGLARLANPEIDLDSIAPFINIGVEESGVILIAVPTTSGSGSDASFGIVLTRISNGEREKVALGSYEVVPYASILDPAVTLGMPRGLTVGTGVDVLSHAIEALVSTNANPLSEALAIKAAEIVFTKLPKVVEDPEDREARALMHIAATMAGMAFTNSGLGLAHAIAHPLGARLRTHHGATVGAILPHVVKYNSDRSESARMKYDYLKRLLEGVAGLPSRSSLVDHILDLYSRIGQPYRISQLAPVSKDEYISMTRSIAEAALRDPDIVFNPVIPTVDDIESILRNAY